MPTTPEDFAQQDSGEVEDLKRKLRAAERRLMKFETAAEKIREIIVGIFDEPLHFDVPPPPKLPSARGKKEEVPVLHLTDLQGGKVTETYDTVVLEERVMQAVETTARITNIRRTGAKIDHLRLYLGGDIVEGENIFPGQLHETDPPSVFEQACRTLPTILTRAVLTLLGTFKTIRICAVPGNHGRTGRKGDGFSLKTNWDMVCYHVLQTILLGHDEAPNREMRKRIEFVEAEDAFHVTDYIWDWGNLLIHGDKGIYSALGLPHYAIQRRAMGWSDVMSMAGEPFDYIWLGHFHTNIAYDVNSKVVLATGSPESDNQFARSNLAAASFPSQRLAFFTEKRGLITDHRIYLEDRLPARSRHELWAPSTPG